ncbi:hypothetical protein AB432_025915 [Brevibacillus brevis]|uniref:DUF1080 domain-containing protein n=1 Tax=Brevibacillus brevis TaxID=1393 RepID=A0A2Z4MNX8_BREBE|nr:hypothetical protein [Brevibacillus brevis]AWX58266.1 hypothetical protein AB432_025915 [Brevibacillus brevis]
MSTFSWNLRDDLHEFDLGESQASPDVWANREALYLEGMGAPVFLRQAVPYPCFRLQAEVAIPKQVGFVGLVFGARDVHNYELVYLAPEEIQYDPIMNGSMTWQIYNGPGYQKPLSYTIGEWKTLAVEVQANQAVVYLGEDPAPQLFISHLQHGTSLDKIGFWNYLPAYIRNLSVTEIAPTDALHTKTDRQQLTAEGYLTEWLISKSYIASDQSVVLTDWTSAVVEENGTLNFNRLFPAKPGMTVQAKSTITVPHETVTQLHFGYSDHLRLWVNEEEVHQGVWRWNPPVSDGRIRSKYAQVSVRLHAGVNTVRAEIMNQEQFGWGICVKARQNEK